MSEPTVLDYVKEKLTFWKKGKLHIPTLEEIRMETPQPEAEVMPQIPAAPVKTGSLFENFSQLHLPGRALFALALALMGQSFLEANPPGLRKAVLLYTLAMIFAVWAFLRDEWILADLPEDMDATGSLSVRWNYAAGGLILSAFTFLACGGGKFNPLNVTLWLISVLLWIQALVDLKSGMKHWFADTWRWLITWPKDWKITREGILVTVAVLVVVFFRAYRINQVPLEMTSDHIEKLMDVQDVLNGETSIFFPRNTGREAFQFYLTVFIIQVFHTGISFLSLKIGTVAAGIFTLPYIYLTGKEIANKRVGFLAMFLAGIAYWPNVIARVGLRFPLYPLFTAPVMYHFLRGMRTKSWKDIVLAGVFLGIGLHGYTPFRIVPLLVVVGVVIYLVHAGNSRNRVFSLQALLAITVISFAIFMPLFRYALDHPDQFMYRILTRTSGLEQPIQGSPALIFLDNFVRSMEMFGYDDGSTWLHSVVNRPALDVIGAALFYLGLLLLILRCFQKRRWQDIFLVLSIPILMLPSTLSIAFPIENPNLPRSGGAIIPTFVIIALALDGILSSLEKRLPPPAAKPVVIGFTSLLLLFSMIQNYDLIFHKYNQQYLLSSGNTSEMGQVIKAYAGTIGTPDTVWIVGYPYWVDTRLPSVVAGYPIKDFAIWPDQFADTLNYSGPKLFIFNKEDTEDMGTLHSIYPRGTFKTYTSSVPGKDFLMMFVPPEN